METKFKKSMYKKPNKKEAKVKRKAILKNWKE